MAGHIFPNKGALKSLMSSRANEPLIMLNLLRFRDVADYTNDPQLKPSASLSGEEAYQLYIAHALPFIAAKGGRRKLLAPTAMPLIGPLDENWDLVLQVYYPSAEAFKSFAMDPNYLAGVGHRTAALEDSRLIPLLASGFED